MAAAAPPSLNLEEPFLAGLGVDNVGAALRIFEQLTSPELNQLEELIDQDLLGKIRQSQQYKEYSERLDEYINTLEQTIGQYQQESNELRNQNQDLDQQRQRLSQEVADLKVAILDQERVLAQVNQRLEQTTGKVWNTLARSRAAVKGETLQQTLKDTQDQLDGQIRQFRQLYQQVSQVESNRPAEIARQQDNAINQMINLLTQEDGIMDNFVTLWYAIKNNPPSQEEVRVFYGLLARFYTDFRGLFAQFRPIEGSDANSVLANQFFNVLAESYRKLAYMMTSLLPLANLDERQLKSLQSVIGSLQIPLGIKLETLQGYQEDRQALEAQKQVPPLPIVAPVQPLTVTKPTPPPPVEVPIASLTPEAPLAIRLPSLQQEQLPALQAQLDLITSAAKETLNGYINQSAIPDADREYAMQVASNALTRLGGINAVNFVDFLRDDDLRQETLQRLQNIVRQVPNETERAGSIYHTSILDLLQGSSKKSLEPEEEGGPQKRART